MDSDKQEPASRVKADKRRRRITKSGVATSIIVIAALAFGGFMTYKYQDVKNNPQVIIEADQRKLLDKVAALINVPTDEQPSVATVSDKEQLVDQPFFKDAENGDVLVIYTDAKKAILYRESANRIIEVAPIAIDATAGTEPVIEDAPQEQEAR